MNKKSMVLLVIIILLLGWLVASSVTSFQDITVGNTQSTNPGGSGTGTGTGSGGSGTGSGSGGSSSSGGSGSGISYNGFPFSLNFSGFFHFPSLKFPNFNFSLNFSGWKFPFNLSFFGSLFGLHGSKGGTGGSGGSGGSSGSKGSGTQGTGNGGKVNPILPIVLNPIILIIIVAIISIVLAFTVVTHAKRNRDSSRKDADKDEILVPEIVTENSKESQKSRQELMDLANGEMITGFTGWSSAYGLIHPPIPEDLPLIWQEKDPIAIKVAEDSELAYPSGSVKSRDGVYSLNLRDRCSLIKAVRGDMEDSIILRASDYSEDIRRFFLLNFVNSKTGIDPGMTAREIIAKMKPVGSESQNMEYYDNIVSAYERSYYGYKKVMRDEFESYLRNLARLNDPKIIVCAGI